jgi:hypothetical protein
MVVDKELWSDQELLGVLRNLKQLMEIEFGRKTNLTLESISLSGDSEYRDL